MEQYLFCGCLRSGELRRSLPKIDETISFEHVTVVKSGGVCVVALIGNVLTQLVLAHVIGSGI